jgi:hypothetical protein
MTTPTEKLAAAADTYYRLAATSKSEGLREERFFIAKSLRDYAALLRSQQPDQPMVPLSAIRPIAVEAIRSVTGCPDVEGNGKTLVSELEAVTRAFAGLPEQQGQDEPFGYFKAEPFGWTDCAATDEGAVALYERPQPRKEGQSKDEREAFEQACRLAMADSETLTFLREPDGSYDNTHVHFAWVLWQAARLSAPQAAGQWRSIDEAEEGPMYVAGYIGDDGFERLELDYLEDGVWHRHHENYEHYMMVGGPKHGPGPSEKAPYTHLIKLDPLPPTTAGEGG